MEKGLLSVIVPVYNGEKYLQETLDSLKNADYHNLEIIIVDDGSEDNSYRIYQKYEDADKRFKVIWQENGGIANARNRGLFEADGEYIGFCDQDDIVSGDFYKKAIEKMEHDDSDICICSSKKFYEIGDRRTRIYEKQQNALYVEEEIDEKILLPSVLANYIKNLNDEIIAKGTIWNCIIRKKVIDQYQLRFQSNVHFEDDWLMRINVLLKAKRVSTIEEFGYYWRTNLRSESNRRIYIENIKEKQADTRNYVAEQMRKNGLELSAEKYESYQKCFDIIKILENENMIKRSKRQRRKYLESILKDLNTVDVKKSSKDIKKGEIRYRMILFFMRKECYFGAYQCNSILMKIRSMLYSLKMVYFVENIVNRV